MRKREGLLRVWQARITRYFPEHQIYFRTNGNVRFLRISTGAQIVGASIALVLTCSFLTAGATVLFRQEQLESKQAAIALKERELAQLAGHVAAVKSDVSEVAQRIEKRQQFLNQLFLNRLQVSARTAKRQNTDLASAAPAPDETAALNPGALEEMQLYRGLESRQLAFVETATDAADARFRETEAVLRRLGLNSSRLIGQSRAVGGPYVEASFKQGAFAGLGTQFKDLFIAWNRLDLLEKASLSIPSLHPVQRFTYSSGFGVRYDPFNGSAAMHTGVDLTGSHGAPIRATADGVVTRAAYWGAYGKVVEVDHGRGLVTRYGHMSKINVRTGERVKRGQVVGAMGNTGRSTGTHLHYEVRVDGRAVNPKPFLEASADVLEIQKRAIEQARQPVGRG